MPNLVYINGKYEVLAGSHIQHTIDEAIKLAQSLNNNVTFIFNEIVITVAHNSPASRIYRDWRRAMKGYIGKNVGPYPSAFIPIKEIFSEARKEIKRWLRNR